MLSLSNLHTHTGLYGPTTPLDIDPFSNLGLSTTNLNALLAQNMANAGGPHVDDDAGDDDGDDRDYELIIRQEPKQARMCGVGGKADRRPIDPPPIVQLRVIDKSVSRSNSPDGVRSPAYNQSFLQNPYYFMFASLASVDSDEEQHLLKDLKTRCTTGSVVSSLYHLKDTEGDGERGQARDAGFFVFPDISVRMEGSYRLKLTLYEVIGASVHFCKSIFSAPFYVYTAKKFPGMEESTGLSCALADQGIKIRIRKDIRMRKNRAAGIDPSWFQPLPDDQQPWSQNNGGNNSKQEDTRGESDEEEDEDEARHGGKSNKRRRLTAASAVSGQDLPPSSVAAPAGQGQSQSASHGPPPSAASVPPPPPPQSQQPYAQHHTHPPAPPHPHAPPHSQHPGSWPVDPNVAAGPPPPAPDTRYDAPAQGGPPPGYGPPPPHPQHHPQHHPGNMHPEYHHPSQGPPPPPPSSSSSLAHPPMHHPPPPVQHHQQQHHMGPPPQHMQQPPPYQHYPTHGQPAPAWGPHPPPAQAYQGYHHQGYDPAYQRGPPPAQYGQGFAGGPPPQGPQQMQYGMPPPPPAYPYYDQHGYPVNQAPPPGPPMPPAAQAPAGGPPVGSSGSGTPPSTSPRSAPQGNAQHRGGPPGAPSNAMPTTPNTQAKDPYADLPPSSMAGGVPIYPSPQSNGYGSYPTRPPAQAQSSPSSSANTSPNVGPAATAGASQPPQGQPQDGRVRAYSQGGYSQPPPVAHYSAPPPAPPVYGYPQQDPYGPPQSWNNAPAYGGPPHAPPPHAQHGMHAAPQHGSPYHQQPHPSSSMYAARPGPGQWSNGPAPGAGAPPPGPSRTASTSGQSAYRSISPPAHPHHMRHSHDQGPPPSHDGPYGNEGRRTPTRRPLGGAGSSPSSAGLPDRIQLAPLRPSSSYSGSSGGAGSKKNPLSIGNIISDEPN